MFYNFNQNNSGGVFEVNDTVCHQLYIEADSFDEAISKAEELGCYWDGVYKGLDCPCCGDRWSCYEDAIDIDRYKTEGYTVSVYDNIYPDTEKEWWDKYGKYEIVEEPKYVESFCYRSYTGRICFKDIEEYAQYMADKYGWTSPDARIFYKDGTVKEIYSNKKIMD